MTLSTPLLQRHVSRSLRAELDSDAPASFSKPVSRKTFTFAELPEWMKDNEFILTGYRGELNSWYKCLKSVFGYLHNETVNIHTHLHASILFAFFLHTFSDSYFKFHKDVSWADYAAFGAFLSSACFCLLCSAFYHMSASHSTQVHTRSVALDYVGIVVLVLGSFYACLYYGFYCEPRYKIGYMLLITLSGLAAAYFVLNPEYSKPTHRHARARVFLALGLSGILPFSHLLLFHGPYTLLREMGFIWLLAAGVMYTTGALLYACRIPEKLYPGRFDYFFSSHQIFHVFVVLAALSTYVSGVGCACHESREGITLGGNILLDERYFHYRLILAAPGFRPDEYILLGSAFIDLYTYQGKDAVPEYLESEDEQEGVSTKVQNNEDRLMSTEPPQRLAFRIRE